MRTVHRFGYRFVADVTETRRRRGRTATSDVSDHRRSAVPAAAGQADIGRSSDAAIRIDAGGVSRHHARIVVSGDEARVEDLGSKNGTFVEANP